jgi:phage terminase large subunit-like protein
VFKEEWLKYYEEVPADEPMRVYLFIDPAISESKYADNRAVIVAGVLENMDWYILDYVRGVFPVVDDHASGKRNLMGELFRLVEMWKPEFVGCEESGFQKALTYLITKEQEKRGVFFGITRLIPRNRQTKTMRIETLAAPFAAGRVYLKKNMTELKSELLGFPAGRYKDLIDALSYLTQYEVPPSEPITSEYNPLSMTSILAELRNKGNKRYPFQHQLGGQA